jgi:hypothetical protein
VAAGDVLVTVGRTDVHQACGDDGTGNFGSAATEGEATGVYCLVGLLKSCMSAGSGEGGCETTWQRRNQQLDGCSSESSGDIRGQQETQKGGQAGTQQLQQQKKKKTTKKKKAKVVFVDKVCHALHTQSPKTSQPTSQTPHNQPTDPHSITAIHPLNGVGPANASTATIS